MTISIRDLSRNSDIFTQYDYVNIEDKKTKTYKGLLVSSQYAQMVKEFLNKTIAKEKEKKLNAIMKFAGSMDGESENMSSQEIKSSQRADYYEQ